jgi:hypothetical protein
MAESIPHHHTPPDCLVGQDPGTAGVAGVAVAVSRVHDRGRALQGLSPPAPAGQALRGATVASLLSGDLFTSWGKRSSPQSRRLAPSLAPSTGPTISSRWEQSLELEQGLSKSVPRRIEDFLARATGHGKCLTCRRSSVDSRCTLHIRKGRLLISCS